MNVQQGRAWRRRGLLVMCRAHPVKVRSVVKVAEVRASFSEQQRERRRRHAERLKEVKLEVDEDWAPVCAEKGAARKESKSMDGQGGASDSFDTVVAWIKTLTDEDVFRTIVGFL